MGRLPWKKDKVFAVETRPKVWAIGQMLDEPHVAFFDLFTRTPAESTIDLEKCRVLFVCAVMRQFISCSSTMRLTIAPRISIPIPKRWFDPYAGDPSNRAEEELVLFQGTRHERKTWMWPGVRLVEKGRTRLSSPKTLVAMINKDDDELVESYELTNIRMHPELNERLYLCYKLGKNVDPLKDLILRRNIPLIYKRYVDI
jgi:hypothetical protein